MISPYVAFMVSRVLPLLLVCASVLWQPLLHAHLPRVESGRLGESRYLLAAQDRSIEPKGIILLAHGYRPEDAELSASFAWDRQPYRMWRETGYIIASTSYRRNGWIIEDAIEDLETLRAFVVEKYNFDGPLYLYGESMGGVIITKIAEDPALSEAYEGAVALSAALYPEQFDPDLEWKHAPLFPVIYLSNSDEVAPLERYAKPLPDLEGTNLAIWQVDRPGHVNFEPAEEAAAFDALLQWVDKGVIEHRHNPTVEPDAFVSEATWSDDGLAATASIRHVDPTFGNLDTAFNAADFDHLGIAQGDAFTVSANGHSFTGIRGVTYSDVARGEWLAVPLPTGQMRIVINFGQADDALEVRRLDDVTVRKAEPPRRPNRE
jgi:hypothetical protein